MHSDLLNYSSLFASIQIKATVCPRDDFEPANGESFATMRCRDHPLAVENRAPAKMISDAADSSLKTDDEWPTVFSRVRALNNAIAAKNIARALKSFRQLAFVAARWRIGRFTRRIRVGNTLTSVGHRTSIEIEPHASFFDERQYSIVLVGELAVIGVSDTHCPLFVFIHAFLVL